MIASRITAPDWDCERAARARQDKLLKPQGSLGRLEDLACWFAARQSREIPRTLAPAITVFAADHGVSSRGVSAYPAAVTGQMLSSLAAGTAAIAVLAQTIQAAITIVDVGVALDGAPPAGVCNERIARGTHDFTTAPAMSTEQVTQALAVGARYAAQAIVVGSNILIAGEVGIGNTTSAAALICALLNADPADIVGHGTGLTDAQREHKIQVVREGLARVRHVTDPLALLAEIGGLEIAAMAGYYLEAARRSVPCLLDGFISTAAALIACRLEAGLHDWLLASHVSGERGHGTALQALRLKPLLDFRMRLGEGSGAALVMPLLQTAIKLHADMATFEEAGVAGKEI
jgi:nicotinate-nucleotide--dimethylbenzimidazole phosphoribosyltransferase